MSNKTYVSMSEFVAAAIQFEEESAAFYKEIQQAEGLDEEAIKLLNRLEEEELNHAAGLKGLNIDDKSAERIQFTPDLELSMPAAPKNKDLESLFNVAIEREAKSVRLYEYASDYVTSEFKKLLESLVDFEKAHERYIKKIRQDYRNK